VGSTNKKAIERKTGDKYAKPTKGIALCYIDARDVENRLDEVVGVGNWETRYEYHGNTCVCYLTIDGVTKANGSGDTAVEAEKGAISKAFVRAGSSWGIGRYLYNAENIWVELDEWGKIKQTEYKKLDKMLDRISKGEVVNGEKEATKQKNAQKPKNTIIERTKKAVAEKQTVEELNELWNEKIVPHIQKESEKVKDECQLIYSTRFKELTGHAD
jgi:hypothetical protein